ncbi:MAG: hypothetical protein AB7F75_03015 [Planctomycetota bacterium]
MRWQPLALVLVLALTSCRESVIHSEPLEALLTTEQRAEYRMFREEATFTRILHRNFTSDMQTYDFLLNRLDFLGLCMRELKIRPYIIKPRGDGSFDFDDTRGIRGVMREWVKGVGRRLFRASVTGRGPLGIEVKAEVLMLLEYSQHAAPGTVQNSLEVFVKLGGFAGAMAPLILPLAGRTFDERIDSVLGGARDLSELISRDPALFLHRVGHSPGIPSDEVLKVRRFLDEQGKLEHENPGGP